MLELFAKAFGIIIVTILLVKFIGKIFLPWFMKKYFPHKYESFRKEYLEPMD